MSDESKGEAGVVVDYDYESTTHIEPVLKNVTVSKIREALTNLWNAKTERDYYKDLYEEKQQCFRDYEQEVQNILEAAGLERFDTEFCTVNRVHRSSVALPQDSHKKALLFDWLQRRGLYEDFVTVNSQRLNALYRSEEEAALARGEIDFKIPGLEPRSYTQIQLRKKR